MAGPSPPSPSLRTAVEPRPPRVLSTLYGSRLRTLHHLLIDLLGPAISCPFPSSGNFPASSVYESNGNVPHSPLQAVEAGVQNTDTGHLKVPVGDCRVCSGNSNRRCGLQPEITCADQIATVANGWSLIREGDSVEYVTLLENSYAVVSESAPSIGVVTVTQRWSQRQVVDRVIELQFRQDANCSHVLCLGYRQIRPTVVGMQQVSAPQGLEYKFPNAAVELVTSHAWMVLLSRVGDTAMLYMLSHLAIFVPLRSHCFLQVSGPPVTAAASFHRQLVHPTFTHRIDQHNLASSKKQRHQEGDHSFNTDGGATGMDGRNGINSGIRMYESTDLFGLELRCHGAMPGHKLKNLMLKHEDVLKLKGSCHEFPVIGHHICDAGAGEEADEVCKHLCKKSLVNELCGRNSGLSGAPMKQTPEPISDFEFERTRLPAPGPSGSMGQKGRGCKRCRGGDEPACPRGHKQLCTTKIVNEGKLIKATVSQNQGTCLGCAESIADKGVSVKQIPAPYARRSCATFTKQGEKQKHMTERGNEHTERGLIRSGRQRQSPLVRSVGTGGNSSSISGWSVVKCGSNMDAADKSSSMKRVRPSSWQRRRARAMQNLVSAHPSCCIKYTVCTPSGQIGVTSDMSLNDCRVVDAHAEATVQRPVPKNQTTCYVAMTPPHEGFHRSNITKRRSSHMEKGLPISESANESGRANSHSYAVKQAIGAKLAEKVGPSGRIINRAPLFYNSSFARHAGLPATPNDTGVSQIFGAIFGMPDLALCSSSKERTLEPAVAGSKKEIIKNVKQLLGKLLRNAKHCGYARLLQRHCPLPSHLESRNESKDLNLLEEGYATQEEDIDLDEDSVSLSGVDSAGLADMLSTSAQMQSTSVFKTVVDDCDTLQKMNAAQQFRSDELSNGDCCTSTFSEAGDRERVVKQMRAVEMNVDKDVSRGHTRGWFHMKGSQRSPICTSNKEAVEGGEELCKVQESHAVSAGQEASIRELIACDTRHCQVVAFLWAVCRSLIPKEFLGSTRNWRSLRRSIACFVGLRRHETFYVQHTLNKLQRSGFTWLNFGHHRQGKQVSGNLSQTLCQVSWESKEVVEGVTHTCTQTKVGSPVLLKLSNGATESSLKCGVKRAVGSPDSTRCCAKGSEGLYESPDRKGCSRMLNSPKANNYVGASASLAKKPCLEPKGRSDRHEQIGKLPCPNTASFRATSGASCARLQAVSAGNGDRVPEEVVIRTAKATPSAGERAFQQKMLEDWLFWFFSSLIVPLIRAHFYVTESENHRQNVFYYRKPVWATIHSLAMRELTATCYKKMTLRSVADMLEKRALGFSQIRMVPKNNGVRPICNLSSPSKCALPFGLETREQICTKTFGGCGKSAMVSGLSGTDSGGNNSVGDLQQPLPTAFTPKVEKKEMRFAFKSINSVLKDTHVCLKYEQGSHPEDLGSSVFGYKDIYFKLLPFIIRLKGHPGGVPPLYMAVCDVSKAYDTIQQDKLCQVVHAFVRSPIFTVKRFACVSPTVGSLRVAYERECTLFPDHLNSLDFAMDLTIKRSHSILQDQAVATRIVRAQVMAFVEEHVKRNMVRIGSNFYQQTVGIPQGSVLSSLLCSVFYGHLDTHELLPLLQKPCTHFCIESLEHNTCSVSKNPTMNVSSDIQGVTSYGGCAGPLEAEAEAMLHLLLGRQGISGSNSLQDSHQELLHSCVGSVGGSLEELASSDLSGMSSKVKDAKNPSEATASASGESILLRLIDDSLLISTSEDVVGRFVDIMHKGFREYGCHANRHKTAVSFNLLLSESQDRYERKVYVSDDGASFMRWSGLLINCCTLEIQADYTRYVGEHIKGTLSIVRHKNPGVQVPFKLCHFMRAKCHPLLYDLRINSPSTVRLNAFQGFLLCAMKFHAYVCCLPRITAHHPPFLLEAILCTSRYMHRLLKKRMQAIGASGYIALTEKEVDWLGLVAFRKVLLKKQSRYSVLLGMLQARLHMSKYRALHCCPHLMSAIGNERSSIFKQIKY